MKCNICGKDPKKPLSSFKSVSLKLPNRKNNIYVCGYCLMEGQRDFLVECGYCPNCMGRGSITTHKSDDSYSEWTETHTCTRCGGLGTIKIK